MQEISSNEVIPTTKNHFLRRTNKLLFTQRWQLRVILGYLFFCVSIFIQYAKDWHWMRKTVKFYSLYLFPKYCRDFPLFPNSPHLYLYNQIFQFIRKYLLYSAVLDCMSITSISWRFVVSVGVCAKRSAFVLGGIAFKDVRKHWN